MPQKRRRRGQFMRSMAVRRGGRFVSRFHRKKQMTIPLGLVFGLLPGIANIYKKFANTENLSNQGGFGNAVEEAVRIYTGITYTDAPQYNYLEGKGFHPQTLMYGLVPLLGGLGLHWLVGNKLGVNRMMSRAGIPLIRI